MYDEESEGVIWITQSRYSKTDCAFNVDDFVSFDDENHSLTVAELPKDNLTHISDIDMAERIQNKIPKPTRNSTDWDVGVWQEWARRRNSVHVNMSVPADIVGVRNDELKYWLAKFVLKIRKKESGDDVV